MTSREETTGLPSSGTTGAPPASARGVALLEVVVALAIVALSAFFIAQVVGAAVRFTGAADATQRALDEAQASLAPAAAGSVGPTWQRIDACATCPDGAAVPPASCHRRAALTGAWVWVEVVCNPAADPARSSSELRGAGVAPRVRIVARR